MPRIRDALGWLLPARDRTLPAVMAATEHKASATARVVAWETLGRPVWSPRDYQSFAHEGFMQNPIVYRSVRMIAEAAATIPLLLYEGVDEIESHPLLDLVARPNADQTGTDFLESWYGYLLVSGNAYAEAVAVGGRLREVHALRPDRMKVVPGADGWPEAYEYTAAGGSVRLAGEIGLAGGEHSGLAGGEHSSLAGGEHLRTVRRVLHVKLFHPTNDHYGMSPIEAAAVAIDTHNTAAQWNKALLDNAARPSGALVYASRDGHLTDEQFGRLKAELEAGFQGARNAGRPLLLEGGLDWKPLSLSPKDMDFVEAKNAAAREIALALGVPPMLLGIPGDNTYSNYQEASRGFWRQTVLPLVNRTAKALSGWLGPGYGGGLELRPDLDQIEALAGEREALWTRLGKAEFLTDDEKRAAVGYGPRADAGRQLKRNQESTAKFNPHHDSAGRFTSADGAAGGGDDPFVDTLLEIVVGQGESESQGGDGEAQLHLVSDRPGSSHRAIDVEEEDARYGGHAFKRHVARPDAELLGIVSRDRYDGLFVSVMRKAQGSFLTKEDANNLVSRVLEANAAEVEKVATGGKLTAEFEQRFGHVTGKEAFRPGPTSEPYMRPTYEVYVWIDHDRRSPRGFRVFTAYPMNQRSAR